MKYSLIHPSRSSSRVQKAFDACYQWLRNASDDIQFEYILSLDSDDEAVPHFQKAFSDFVNVPITIITNNNRSIVDAVNRAAEISTGDILIVVSDDFSCPVNWDREILKAVEGKQDWVLKVDDGSGTWIVTLPIMDQEYYEKAGFIYDPSYTHLFVDTAQTHKAILSGKIIYAEHLTFVHHHPDLGKGVKDALNERNNKTWFQGEKVYIEQVKKYFGLKPEEIIGQITNQDHIAYLKKHGIEI
jgi:hypothetical protein